MQHAANAYATTAKAALTPRELEAQVLMNAAARLQGIQDNWDARKADLDDALIYNRKIWTVIASSATEEDNPLPRPIKQNIANLAIFIFNHTMKMMIEPSPDRLRSLVSINRELAAGLRSRPPAG